MRTTTKGKNWELLHSLWIFWTVTMVLSWVSFLYIGIRTRQRKWLLWALAYSTPFIFTLIFAEAPIWGPRADFVLGLAAVTVGVASLVHALLIRREYLMRLEALRRGRAISEPQLQRKYDSEYEADAYPPTTGQNGAPASAVDNGQLPDLQAHLPRRTDDGQVLKAVGAEQAQTNPTVDIRLLAELRDEGLVCAEEFEAKKRELLDRL